MHLVVFLRRHTSLLSAADNEGCIIKPALLSVDSHVCIIKPVIIIRAFTPIESTLSSYWLPFNRFQKNIAVGILMFVCGNETTPAPVHEMPNDSS